MLVRLEQDTESPMLWGECEDSSMNSDTSDQILVLNALRGDLDAFNQLVMNYQDIAFGYANFFVGDPDLAEDITQESFIKAFQKISSFHGGSFRAWLLKIVTNTSYDRLRQIRRNRTFSLNAEDENGEEFDSLPWFIDQTASVEESVQRKEETQHLYHLLGELPAGYRSVITLIDLYEFDYTEAAEILHIPLGTLKSRLARARSHLRDTFQHTRHISFNTAGRLPVAQA